MDCETELQTMSVWMSTKPLLSAPVSSPSWFTWPSIGCGHSRNSEMQETKDIRVLPLPFAHPQCLLKFCVLKCEVYGMPQVGSGGNQLFALQPMQTTARSLFPIQRQTLLCPLWFQAGKDLCSLHHQGNWRGSELPVQGCTPFRNLLPETPT